MSSTTGDLVTGPKGHILSEEVSSGTFPLEGFPEMRPLDVGTPPQTPRSDLPHLDLDSPMCERTIVPDAH